MRNLVAGMAVAILLTACGTTTQRTPDAEPTEVGYLTFDFRPALQTAQDDAYPEPETIRVIIAHAAGYKLIRDIELPATAPEIIELPARNGYEVTAFSYLSYENPASRRKWVLKDGLATGVVVRAGQSTEVELTLQPITFSFDGVPESVESGETYALTVTRTMNLAPTESIWLYISEHQFDIPMIDSRSATDTTAEHPATLTVAGTADYEGTTIFHMATGFLSERYLNAEEHFTDFAFVGPTTTLGQVPVTVDIVPPGPTSGTIDLIVVY